MGSVKSDSTARAKHSPSFATHRAPLMTPPPTPKKPKPKSAQKYEVHLQHNANTAKLKKNLEGTKSILAATHEFLLGIRAEQSILCQQTDTLERRLKSTLSTAERRRVEKMLELTVALGCELVIEECGFREIWETSVGDNKWDLERELEGLKGRVGRCVEVFDGRMGVLGGK